jgi:hypothetical protein
MLFSGALGGPQDSAGGGVQGYGSQAAASAYGGASAYGPSTAVRPGPESGATAVSGANDYATNISRGATDPTTGSC